MTAALAKGRLSPDELATVESLAQRGWKAGRIAVKLDRLPTTISYVMTRLGLREPADRSFALMRKGKLVKSFPPEEDAFIEAARAEGLTCQRIADQCFARFGHVRSVATISLRLKMIANRAEAAQ